MSERLLQMREKAPVGERALEYFDLDPEYREMMMRAGMVVELTHGCTVNCNFCAIADKGSITSKMSWENASKIAQSLSSKCQQAYDFFYWGKDPFEWIDNGHTYQDLAAIAILEQGRMVYTSTAIPVDTEHQVVEFVEFLRYTVASPGQAILRISHTAQNNRRFNTVMEQLKGLGYDITNNKIIAPDDSRMVAKYEDRMNQSSVLRTGKNSLSGLSLVDVCGPACKDGLIISPTGLDVLITMPHSTTVPSGELRIPFNPKAPILPRCRYTYQVGDLSLNLVRGSIEPENMSFIESSRKFLGLINSLNENRTLIFDHSQPDEIPKHSWNTWYNNTDPLARPIRRDDAEVFSKTARKLMNIFENANDPLLVAYTQIFLSDMEAIRDRKYQREMTRLFYR